MNAKPKNPVGRPSDYTPELEERIIDLISEGMTVSEIGRMPDMPTRQTLARWAARDQAFCDAIARARKAFWMLDGDELVRGKIDGGSATDDSAVRVARDRLGMDGFLRLMKAHVPNIYGDKTQTELTGKDGADLIPRQTPEEIDARIAQLSAENPGLLESLLKKGSG